MIVLANVVQVQNPKIIPNDLPMGLIYLGSALKKAGYQVKIYHISQYQIENAALEIAKLKPLFVGVSVLTGVSTLHNLVLSQKIRNLEPTIPIIWGGHHPTTTPDQCLEQSCVDYVFMGEGEEGIVQFAQAVAINNGFDSIPGLAMKIDEKIFKNSPPVLIKNIDALDFDLSILDNPSQYISGGDQVMMFQTARGCPFHCGFCHISNFYTRSYRQFSIDYVLYHAKKFRDMFGVRTIHITDDILFLNQRDIAVMKGLRDLGINIGTVAIRISHLYKHPEIMKVLQDFNVTAVFLAWESGVDRILKLMHKDITQEMIFHTVRFLADKYPEITLLGGGIIGNPTETMEEIQQTVKTAMDIRAIHPDCLIFLQLYLPLPGTEFLDLAICEGMALPRCPEDWAHRDPYWKRNCVVDWIPWAKDEQKRLLVSLDIYSRQGRDSRGSGGILNQIVKGLFSEIARYRYNHLFFVGSEIDMWLYDKLSNVRRVFLNDRQSQN